MISELEFGSLLKKLNFSIELRNEIRELLIEMNKQLPSENWTVNLSVAAKNVVEVLTR